MLVYSVSVSAELKYNGSESETFTLNVNVPAYTTLYARAGTDKVKGTARIVTLNEDCTTTTGSTFSYNYGYQKAYEWY